MAPVTTHKESRARAEAAFQLRAKGWTWQAVADELEFRSPEGARMAVTRLVGRLTGDPMYKPVARAATDEGLRMQYEKLRPMFDHAVERDDTEAATMLSRELRAVSNDRAKLTGIAAPQRVAVDVNVNSTAAILADAKRRLLAIDNVIDAEVIEA